ncbi:MAG: LysR family transcriptional regulator [Deltaproteobacteria bacterium]|nr:LysR family transcriptional regulator [Deltaproteobacteria bacterium]
MKSADFALLATLDALLQEGSVTGAAKRMGLSTPAMSHGLARVRERLEDPLLVRAGRGMVLTPRAAALKSRVHAAVQEARQVLEPDAPFAPADLRRVFSILATDYVLCVLGSVVDRLLQAEAPGVSLRFTPNTQEDPGALREGADLSIGIYAGLPPEMRTRTLLTDRFVVVVREGHPLARRKLTLEQFVQQPHIQIAPRGQPGGYLDDVLREKGCERRVARAVPYFLPALYLASQTDYLLTTSERVARELAPLLGLRLLEPPLALKPYALSLVWHPRFDADEGHRFLREIFIRAAREAAGDRHEGARTQLGSGPSRRGRAKRTSRK